MGLVKTLFGDVEHPLHTHEAQRLCQGQTSHFYISAHTQKEAGSETFQYSMKKMDKPSTVRTSTCSQKQRDGR